MEKIFREHNDYDFDAEGFYRESEAAVEERDYDLQSLCRAGSRLAGADDRAVKGADSRERW